MSRRRFGVSLLVLGAVVTGITMAGIAVRATYGAQTTADEPQYLLSALSLFEDGDLDISDELSAERYRVFHEVDLPQQTQPLPGGRRVSPHDPLLPLLLAVPMGLGGWVAAKAAMAIVAGGVATVVAWTAHRRLGVRPWTALGFSAVFALSPPLAIYATQVYPGLPAALAVVVGVACLLGRMDAPGRWSLVAAVVALPWLAIKYVPVAAALAVAGLLRMPSRERIRTVLALAMAGVAYVAAHLWIYGGLTPYATGDHFVGGELTVMGTDVDIVGRATRLVGLWVDRGFGIAAWQPAFLLAPVAVGWWLSRRIKGAVTLVSVVAIGILVATFVALTMHGWWFPGRQLVAVLPVLALLIAVWADRLRLTWTIGLGLVGVVAFGFLVIEGLAGGLTWVVDFGATANPLYRIWTRLLPDYMAAGTGTWVRHGIWAVALVGLIWMGWVQGRERGKEPSVASTGRHYILERT